MMREDFDGVVVKTENRMDVTRNRGICRRALHMQTVFVSWWSAL